MALAYIDARDVMDRLDWVVGPANWQDRYPFVGCCEIGIKVGGEWLWKSNGAGVTQVEAEKGQYSDAFKRAAVLWGIGRYLYDLPNKWYKLKEGGYQFVEKPTLPDWATPAGWNRIPLSQRKAFHEQMLECLARDDGPGIRQLVGEWDQEDQSQLWTMFNSRERAAIKELKND